MTDQSKIRNFSIIAHIDHGKSTLSDRLIEKCNAVSQRAVSYTHLDVYKRQVVGGAVAPPVQQHRLPRFAGQGQGGMNPLGGAAGEKQAGGHVENLRPEGLRRPCLLYTSRHKARLVVELDGGQHYERERQKADLTQTG